MLHALLSRGPGGTARRLLVTVLAAALTVSVAWAGAVIAPAPDIDAAVGTASGALDAFEVVDDAPLGAGQLLVGAAKVSLYPDPEGMAATFPGATWLQGEENAAACTTLSESFFTESLGDPEHPAHLATATASPWPENPDCLYQGGFGIGPVNPILDWDRAPGDPGYVADDDPETGYGLFARTLVLSDGDDTAVITVIDAEGFLYEYANKCVPSQLPVGCGSREIAERLGGELDIDPSAFVIASTHSHASVDLLGGWGYVPDWYFNQVYGAIEQSIREAHTNMVPAHVEVGEERARQFNSERRDTYRSAEEQQLAWLRAVDAEDGDVIATVGAYAAHPTSYGNNNATAHADWVGVFTRRLEDRFGGMGMHLMTGLGNMTNRSGRTGSTALADLIPAVGEGHVLTTTDVRSTATIWQQPVTNAPLNALGLPGFFDRTFVPTPATIRTGKTPETAPCLSASPTSVELQASAIRIGEDFALSAAPGEVFANLTNTVKERSPALVTMPLGQANDALGYMPQQFELNEANMQGAGFVAGGVLVVNYEDSYAVDRCTGDMVLESTIAMLGEL